MTEDEFLAQITAAPNDDDLKLVYADWLDEQGDSRGQLIRLSVEMRRLQAAHGGFPPEWQQRLGIQVDRVTYEESVWGVDLRGHLDCARCDHHYHEPADDRVRAWFDLRLELQGSHYDLENLIAPLSIRTRIHGPY